MGRQRLRCWAVWIWAGVIAAPMASGLAGDTGQLGCHGPEALSGTVAPANPDPELPGFNRQDCTLGTAAAQALGVGFAQGIAARGGDWTKLDAGGGELPADAGSWACLRDNLTGLIWEMKTADGGLHHHAHRYTWRSTDTASNGGDAGTLGTDTCGGTLPMGQCNTEALLAAVNAAGLCGAHDWRLPSIAELESIVDLGVSPRPAINEALFPLTDSQIYWSGSTSAANTTGAWAIVFDGGRRAPFSKGTVAWVRLVRTAP